jgi:hypothetical protein
MALGWYTGQNQWQPRSIVSSDRFIPFNIIDKGTRLALFTNTDAVELNDSFQNIPIGEYRIVFEIDDPTLEHGASQAYTLKWSGSADGFSMNRID